MNSPLDIKKAIITGPTGAVGHALIEELCAHGTEVTAVCRPGSPRIAHLPAVPGLRVVTCEISALASLGDQLEGDYDAFYHFAWDGTYGPDRQDLRRQTGNIRYTLDAVDLAKALGCKVFVGAGSQSEFGHVDGVLTPDLPCNPDNGYGAAKLSAGIMSRLACRQVGIRHVWCRILSLYGPGDGRYTMVMSSILGMLRGQRMQFTPGEQIWDFIYSKDAAEVFRLAAQQGRDGAVYVLGSGAPRTLRSYILAIRDAVDPQLEIGLGELPYYPNQVMHLEADISELEKDLGFTPRYPFEEGICETIQWAREQDYDKA